MDDPHRRWLLEQRTMLMATPAERAAAARFVPLSERYRQLVPYVADPYREAIAAIPARVAFHDRPEAVVRAVSRVRGKPAAMRVVVRESFDRHPSVGWVGAFALVVVGNMARATSLADASRLAMAMRERFDRQLYEAIPEKPTLAREVSYVDLVRLPPPCAHPPERRNRFVVGKVHRWPLCGQCGQEVEPEATAEILTPQRRVPRWCDTP